MPFITTKFKIRSFIILATLAIIFTIATTFVAAENPERPFEDVRILSTVPFPPGFPEGIAVNGDKVYVAGPAKSV